MAPTNAKGGVHGIVGRAARDLRDHLHSNQIRWMPIGDTGMKLLGGNWMAAGADHESEEIELYRSKLDEVTAVVDVGANSGLFSLLAAHAGKPCFAFEPLRANLEYLYESIRENGFAERIEVFPVGPSHKVGIARFYGRGQGASLVPGWAGQPDYDFELVPANRLDNILADRLAEERIMLKLDVEGAELAVLEGATKLLGNCRSVLLEHSLDRNHPGGQNPRFGELFELMWSSGFESRIARKGTPLVGRGDVDRWLAAQALDTGTENFLFTRPG